MSDLIQPLTQSEAFERTCKRLGLSVKRIETADGSCLIQSRKLPMIGTFNLISRGPVLRAGATGEALMRSIGASVHGPVVINAPAGLGRSGLKLMKGAELALVELVQAPAMRARLHQNWRNQLSKAESSPLRVIEQPLDDKRHAWFLQAEQAQQTSRKYRAYPAGFLLAYAAANKGQARLYTAMLGSDPVAAMLVLKHGMMATYQAGITTPQGRKHCAHNLLLWSIMSDLQRRGVRQLDLGRADLSDGLRRFKLRAGATLQALPGTYLTAGWQLRRRRQSGRASIIHA
jgi:hypothetical protein